MHKNLLKIFMDRGYITAMSEIEAPHPRRRVNESFIVRSFAIVEDDYVFWVADCVDGASFSIKGSAITGVDGMEIERLAEVYSLTKEGEKIVCYLKQRGRKRKVREPIIAEVSYGWDDDDYELDY